MKLKTRIFSLVGGLFLVSFLLSTALEIFFSRRAAIKTNTILESYLEDYEIRKQKQVKNFLKEEINDLLATIQGTLGHIKQEEFWDYFFSPFDVSIKYNQWLTAALFLEANKYLDLIQVEINDKITAKLTLDRPPPYQVTTLDLIDEVKICVVDPQLSGSKLKGPYIAVPYTFDARVLPKSVDPNVLSKTQNYENLNYLIFKPEQVLKFNQLEFDQKTQAFMNMGLDQIMNTQYPMTGYEIIEMKKALPLFKDSLIKAQSYLKANPGFYHYITSNAESWMQDQFQNVYDVKKGVNIEFNEFDITRIRYSQIAMIWAYATLIATGISDYTIDEDAPYGLANIALASKNGYGIMADDIFSIDPIEVLSPSLFQGRYNRIFLGDTETISIDTPTGKRETILSVGVDLSEVLKSLALVTDRKLIVVVGQKIIAACDEVGAPIAVNPQDFPLNVILNSPTGTYQDSLGKDYIFLTTQIFPDQNVYFILYRLKSIEFGFIDTVSFGLNQLIRHLTIQNAIIAILTLMIAAYSISKLSFYITSPITRLAKNTKDVQEGHLEKVDLPPVDGDNEDEIEELYHSFSDMVQGLKEKERVKGILNKVVSPKIANKILEGNVTLGGEEKIVTVLFADIRQFTELTEKMRPKELIQILNSYMTELSDVVDRHNGVIDKYVGDEVMALFGAPISEKDSAGSAVLCALEMMKEVELWNNNRIQLGLAPIEIGIGIHTGNVVAGNVGAENRLNYTVLGASVNLAARLCSIAEAKQILISKDTLDALGIREMIEVKEIDPIHLKGFSQAVQIYQVSSKI